MIRQYIIFSFFGTVKLKHGTYHTMIDEGLKSDWVKTYIYALNPSLQNKPRQKD